MVSKSRPSPYPPLPFHGVRAISLIASLIVSGIVGWFCYQLKHDKYKLPWTFLFILVASVSTLLSLALTTCIHICAFLSPLFNLIINIPLLLVWAAGFSLLTWNTLGLLTNTCSEKNWENGDGVMICRSYKANYSFVILGLLAHTAMVIVDIRARRNQTALGKYEQMDEAKAKKVEGDADRSTGQDGGYSDVPYGVDVSNRKPASAVQREQSPYGGGEGYNMSDFGYQKPAQQSGYDGGSYGGGYRDHQQR